MEPALVISGLVERPVTIPWDQLAGIDGAVEEGAASEMGLTGAALPVAAILQQAEPLPQATHGTVVGGNGDYTASIPLEDLREGGWLAYRIGEGPLPPEKGGPLRLTVTQGATLCWNVKQVTEIRLTAGEEPDSVPENPTH